MKALLKYLIIAAVLIAGLVIWYNRTIDQASKEAATAAQADIAQFDAVVDRVSAKAERARLEKRIPELREKVLNGSSQGEVALAVEDLKKAESQLEKLGEK